MNNKKNPTVIDEAGQPVAKTIALPLVQYKTRALLETLGFTVLAIAAPAILAHTPNNQWITGTLVNAILFLAAYRVGIINAVLIGAIPSGIALMRGLLPLPMAAMIPYIIIGNAILVAAFSLTKFKSLTLRIIIASTLKFLVLWGALSLLVNVPAVIAQMMQWPQLITALAGGLIAVSLIKFFPKLKKS